MIKLRLTERSYFKVGDFEAANPSRVRDLLTTENVNQINMRGECN